MCEQCVIKDSEIERLQLALANVERLWREKNSKDAVELRDHFAGKALQGWLASYGPDHQHPIITGHAKKVVEQSYQMADKMLCAREKGK